MQSRANRRARQVLDAWVEDTTLGFLLAAKVAIERPGDVENESLVVDTLERLDLLLRVRQNLRP